MKYVYTLTEYAYEGMDQKGIFSSFDEAKAAGNAYVSWIGNQGPFIWERIHEGSWNLSIDKEFYYMIHKQQLNYRWWEK